MSDVSTTLAERGNRYGSFEEHAKIAQCLKDVMRHSPKWRDLWPDQIEALEMIQHKIARILNGDPNYADSWHDIAGYAKLVDDRLTNGSGHTAGPSTVRELLASNEELGAAVKRAGRKR